MLGFVLSGGGARGAFQAGVCARLREDARFGQPAVLAGTSAGSINAALLAVGKTSEEMRRFWLEMGEDPPVATNTSFFRDGLWSFLKAVRSLPRIPVKGALRSALARTWAHRPFDPGNVGALVTELVLTRRFDLVDRFLDELPENAVADTRPLRARLVKTFGGEVLKTEGVSLAINVVDVASHKPVRFVNRAPTAGKKDKYVVVDHITVDMVLASAAIPILFPPVSIPSWAPRGARFWDGGVLVNTPMAPAVALGAETIVPILSTEEPGASGRTVASMGDTVEHLTDTLLENSFNVDRKLLLERNRVAKASAADYRVVELLRPVRPFGAFFNAGSYLFFEPSKLQRLYDEGREAATRWLAEGPLRDSLEHTNGAAGIFGQGEGSRALRSAAAGAIR